MHIKHCIKEENKIDFRDLNDFELIYLIRRGSEEALSIFFQKYSYLISKKIKSYNLIMDFDDVFQESLIVLNKLLYIYDDFYPFFFYFYVSLDNRLRDIKRKKKREPIIVDDGMFICEKNTYEEVYLFNDELFENLTDEEKAIFYYKLIKKVSVSDISKKYGMKDSKVYYLLNIAKNKVKTKAKQLEFY